jgi:hypothetical protein
VRRLYAVIAARERRKRRVAHGERPGTVRLAIPAGYEARWLSDAEDRDTVERWISNSPDTCLYHAPSYIEFARGQNGSADLLWLARDGNPVVGVPLHPGGLGRFNTGYAGLLFPPGRRDRPIRAGVSAIRELLEANRGTSLYVLQAARSRAYDCDSRGRMVTLARHLEEVHVRLLPLYSRLLDLPEAGTSGSEPDLRAEALAATGFEPYEPQLRNQIRKAVGNGMTVRCELPTNAAEIYTAYHDFVPIHHASWRRTGLNPHEDKYWSALSEAVIGGGGRVLIVYVDDRNGTPAAAVVCHVRDAHALYWAGCSTEEGLRANANPLCLHAAIQACRALGVRRFELGRFFAPEPSDKERAVSHYKAQFGGELVRVVGFESGSGLIATVRRIARLRRPTMWFSYVGA